MSDEPAVVIEPRRAHARFQRLTLWVGLRIVVIACASCSASAEPPVQLLVKVDADQNVRFKLKRLRVELFEASAVDPDAPLRSMDFPLTRGSPNAELQRIPFSFGISEGKHERIEVVVRGYASNDEGAASAIEHKVVSMFREDTPGWVEIYLFEKCYMAAAACTGLDQTCSPPPSMNPSGDSQCVAVDEIDAARSEPQGPPAVVVTSESQGCEGARVCTQPDYACVDGTATGYECRGQFAEWPMPREDDDSPHPPHYTRGPDGATLHDDVTGLTWQRLVPDTYPGCSDSRGIDTGVCSWAQAKAYCDQLELGGETDWRLPTKIELESLISETASAPSLDFVFVWDLEDFFSIGMQTLDSFDFWTASPVATNGPAARAWSVHFGHGISDFESLEKRKLVRCVRSVTTRPGTPADRYTSDFEADVVTDHRTHLIWQRSVGPQLEDHGEAEAHCRERGARLPSKRELLTLVDPTRPPPSIDPSFPEVPSACFWTSSPSTIFHGSEAWFVVCSWNARTSDDVLVREQLEIDAPDQPELRQPYTRCVTDEG